MKKLPLILSFVLFAAATEAGAHTVVKCDIEAAINNRPEDYLGSLGGAITTIDRNGTNVRTGPGKQFPILKTLKDAEGFRFHITGMSGNWVRVDSVYEVRNQQENYQGEKPLNGWVYAPSLFLKAEPSDSRDVPKAVRNLYAQPDMKSRLLLTKKEQKDFHVVSLQGCKGKWAKVSYGKKVGWLNPFTQCADLWTEMCAEGDC